MKAETPDDDAAWQAACSVLFRTGLRPDDDRLTVSHWPKTGASPAQSWPKVDGVGADRLKAVQAGPELIEKIAKDVIDDVGKKIDLLVLTHEHFDHFSGFALAEETFTAADVSIGRLWLAWTEDPEDDQAIALHERFDKGKQA